MRGHAVRDLALLVALVAAPGCHRRSPAAAALDITPQARVQPGEVPAGFPVSIEYRWTCGSAAALPARPYRAFVHFLDRHGTPLFTDDHDPEPPVDSWRPGGRYAYRRTVLTTEFPYAGPLTVVMGLYSPQSGERLALAGRYAGQRRYRAAAFSLLPRAPRLDLRCEGLYPKEAAVSAPLLVTRFMRREASCRLRNPRADLLVFVQGDIEPAAFPSSPVLGVSTPFASATRTLALTEERQLLLFRASRAELGRGEEATLRLRMSATHSAGLPDGDPRERSLRLFRLLVLRAAELDPVLSLGAVPLQRAQ